MISVTCAAIILIGVAFAIGVDVGRRDAKPKILNLYMPGSGNDAAPIDQETYGKLRLELERRGDRIRTLEKEALTGAAKLLGHQHAVREFMEELGPYLGLDGPGPYNPRDYIDAAEKIREWCANATSKVH